MSKAGTYSIPSDPLDKLVARCAMGQAIKLMAATGCTPEQAATLACPGSWAEWRGYVLATVACADEVA